MFLLHIEIFSLKHVDVFQFFCKLEKIDGHFIGKPLPIYSVSRLKFIVDKNIS
jgi:hypothetical protein